MASVLFKMADVNVGYSKVKMDLLKRWHSKVCTKKNPTCVVGRIDNSVPRVTVWGHSTKPRDAKQCPSERMV